MTGRITGRLGGWLVVWIVWKILRRSEYRLPPRSRRSLSPPRPPHRWLGGTLLSRLGEKSARSGVRPWLEFCVCGVSLVFLAGVLVACGSGDPLRCWLWPASLVLDRVLDKTEALSLPPGLGGSASADSSGIVCPTCCIKHFHLRQNFPTSW